MSVSQDQGRKRQVVDFFFQSFSSILASLGGSGQKDGSSTATAQSIQARKPPTPAASATPKQPLKNAQPSAGLKRKIENTYGESPSTIRGNETSAAVTKPSVTATTSPQKLQQQRTTQNVKSTDTASTSKPTVASVQANKPPPKGSYREILARAEAAKGKQSEFGHIKHKRVEKPSREERRLAKEAARTKKGLKRHGSTVTSQRHAATDTRAVDPSKKKRMDPGYKGTMKQRPTQPAYRGTMKVKATSGSPARAEGKSSLGSSANGDRRYRYASYSEEDEEEDYDDESDMEAAGFDELEEEEEQSLRAARKEDAEAKREEEEHRRQKAEKRRKLEQLAAARKR